MDYLLEVTIAGGCGGDVPSSVAVALAFWLTGLKSSKQLPTFPSGCILLSIFKLVPAICNAY